MRCNYIPLKAVIFIAFIVVFFVQICCIAQFRSGQNWGGFLPSLPNLWYRVRSTCHARANGPNRSFLSSQHMMMKTIEIIGVVIFKRLRRREFSLNEKKKIYFKIYSNLFQQIFSLLVDFQKNNILKIKILITMQRPMFSPSNRNHVGMTVT